MTPDNYTNREFFLEVGDGHELYVHDWGSPKAETVVFFLHGGPGDHSKNRHKQWFDPERQRVIFHDQRGGGRSLPAGELQHNKSQDLVEDITKIADNLQIDQFVLTGGSWGSALAFLYAIKHPKRVKAMVLTAIFTCTKLETEWIDNGRFKMFYPEVWERYLAATPQERHDNPSAYHYQTVLGPDSEQAKRSAYAYNNLESGVLFLDDRFEPEEYGAFDPAGAKIEMYYLQNRCFAPEGYIAKHAAKLSMPIWMIQGRYDMVCPPETAYKLQKKLPNSQLVTTIGGHIANHETRNIMRSLLLQITS